MIQSLKDLIARATGQKIELIRMEDYPFIILKLQKALPYTAEESCDLAWEKNWDR